MYPLQRLASIISGNSVESIGTGAKEIEVLYAEKVLNLKIPESYRTFLLNFGWGGIGGFELWGVGPHVPTYLDLIKNTNEERENMSSPLPLNLLPIMNNGFGDLYCIDTTMDPEFPVILFVHDEVSEGKIMDVAPSFDIFLDSLLNEDLTDGDDN